MQDFDTLRDRVEATTEKLRSAQGAREDQTEALVAILGQLEEKHAAQAQQLHYYKNRVEPLEDANQQLTGLMQNLLDLIDSGFGDQSLAPLQNASSMASSMLESDLFIAGETPPAAEPEDSETTVDAVAEDTADVTQGDESTDELMETAESIADDTTVMEEAEDLAPDAEIASEAAETVDAVANDTVEMDPVVEDEVDELPDELPEELIDEATDVAAEGKEAVSDLEMEEDALVSLDQLLDLASEEEPEETVAFEEAEEESEPDMAVAEDSAEAEAEIIDDGGFDTEAVGEAGQEAVASFEDVSDAVLELETEEDAAIGYDDLPDVVKESMGGMDAEEVDLVPEIPSTEGEMDADAVAAEDDLETIAALAQAIEEETADEGAPPPAQSDIRALLLRVEALAKKAESMRLAHNDTEMPQDSAETKQDAMPEEPKKQAGAAA